MNPEPLGKMNFADSIPFAENYNLSKNLKGVNRG